MQTLFDELLLFRFSSSLLPNFKKKQDIARIQLEESRIQILQARWKYEN
jgi:predicted translin family RNA/ssDNA-binding protein